jgi:hypothetical protein
MDQLFAYVSALKPPVPDPSDKVVDYQLRLLTDAIRSEQTSETLNATDPSRFPAPVSQRRRKQDTRRRLRTGIVAGVAAAGMLGGGVAAAATWLAPRPVTNRSIARCYSVTSTAGGSHFPGSYVAAAGPVGSATAANSALQGCALLWRDGFLIPGAPRALHLPGGPLPQHSVPPLVVCTLPGGIAGVFPRQGPSTCQHLGLPPAKTQP